jgi:Na+-driven multidrug efflux pump
MISTTATTDSLFPDNREEEDASRWPGTTSGDTTTFSGAVEVIVSTGVIQSGEDQTSQTNANVSMNDEEIQEQQKEQEPPILAAPSIIDILNFAIPAIGVYLCSPLLSMIDTSSVGLFCGTLQQAALNPAVTIADYSARTMSFLYTGTTNIMASRSSTSRNSSISSSDKNLEHDMIKETFIGALGLSFFVGLGLSGFLLMTSRRMLVPLIGNDSIDMELMNAAWRYIMIRSLGMPAAAMIGTSQAACLGLKDNHTPFKIILAAAAINLFLDVLLVGQQRFPWIGGTAGAAWATIFSQYFAMGLFLHNFTNKQTQTRNNRQNHDSENPSKTKGLLLANNDNDHHPMEIDQWRKKWFFFLKFPTKQTIQNFVPFVIPVTTTQIGRCSTYIAMGHVVSSTMNEVSMAAQQIITSIFYALIPIGDSCSLTAQSFLPSILSSSVKTTKTTRTSTSSNTTTTTAAAAVRKTVKNIYKVAGVMGVFLSMIALLIPLACPLLTSDPAVIATVKSVIPVMLAVLTTHGIFCASEDILVGYRDLKFLGRIYSIFFAVVPMLMVRLKYAARMGGKAVELSSVWTVFLGYQAVRILTFASRSFYLILKTGKDSNVKSTW